MKALVVGINIGYAGHLQGWCIMALVNVSLVENKEVSGVALARIITLISYKGHASCQFFL
jgi:hypothetical protein